MRAWLLFALRPISVGVFGSFLMISSAIGVEKNPVVAPSPDPSEAVAEEAIIDTLVQVDRTEQRKNYAAAKTALNRRQVQTYKKLIATLEDYPLRPYLEYQDIGNRLNALPKAEVAAFLSEYRDSYLSDRLSHRWLRILASRQQWQDYNTFYNAELNDAELACNSLRARLETGDETAYEDVAPLWNIAESQSKTCDPVFTRWITAGKLTPALLWERHSKAVQAGNTGLASYLSRQMAEPQKELASLFQEVRLNPNILSQTTRFSTQSPEMQEIILYGLQRLALQDAPKALTLWQGYDAQQLFEDSKRLETQYHIATRLLRQDNQDAAESLLSSISQITSTDLTEALIRESLRKQDWEKAYNWLTRLPVEAQQTERWLYWRARIMEELDIKEVDGQSVQSLYNRVAATRSFYGFLSADKLGYEYRLVDKPMLISPELQSQVEQAPGVQRARELYILGDIYGASREWFHTTRRMKTDEIVAAGRLADRWGWHRQGIQAMIDAEYWDDLQVRFPLAYQEHVATAAKATSVNPLLLLAIARQESAFSPDARSPAGALGLMQLMPATALHTAKRAGIAYSNKHDLLKPEKNIALGSRYLNQLLNQFNGNRILAAAAYNAGPSRVKQWLSKEDAKLPYDVWIETIPFHETRGYVQNVLSFSVIYGYRTGEKQPFITPLEANNSL